VIITLDWSWTTGLPLLEIKDMLKMFVGMAIDFCGNGFYVLSNSRKEAKIVYGKTEMTTLSRSPLRSLSAGRNF
jgi:hypothetical protein